MLFSLLVRIVVLSIDIEKMRLCVCIVRLRLCYVFLCCFECWNRMFIVIFITYSVVLIYSGVYRLFE